MFGGKCLGLKSKRLGAKRLFFRLLGLGFEYDPARAVGALREPHLCVLVASVALLPRESVFHRGSRAVSGFRQNRADEPDAARLQMTGLWP